MADAPAAEDLDHEFCLNPLHPGPCKGWKQAKAGGRDTTVAHPDLAPERKRTRAKKAPAPSAAAPGSAESPAVVRQKEIDGLRGRATLLSELEEITFLAGAEIDAATRARLRSRISREGLADEPRLAAVVKAVEDGDREALPKLLEKAAKDMGLTRVGGLKAGDPGEATVKFDRTRHRSIGGDLDVGSDVEIVRPGYDAKLSNGESVRLSKADVLEAPRGPVSVPEAKLNDATARLRDIVQVPVSGDREKVKKILEGLTVPQLNEIAERFDKIMYGRSKKERINALVGQLVGFRLDHEAITRVPMREQTAAAAALECEAELAELAEFKMPEQLAESFLHGKAAAQVRLGTRGSFRRCQRKLAQEGVPPEQIDGACANIYKRATGRWPGRKKGDHDMSVNQVACGCGGAEVEEMAAVTPTNSQPWEQPSTSKGWRGPLAPIDVATGDRRRFAPGALGSRMLPLPFRWQKAQAKGHDGAVVVGALTGYAMGDDGKIRGEGYWLDPAIVPEVIEAQHLVEHGLVGPSVDLEPAMEVMFEDPETGEQFTPHVCTADGTCPAEPNVVITKGTIAGATLVPITAFADARAPEMFDRTIADDIAYRMTRQTASVHSGEWDEWPIADRNHPWEPAEAAARVLEFTGMADLDTYSWAFLYLDEHAPFGPEAFKFGFADVIDDELTIIPRAVFAAAAALESANISNSAKEEMREVIDDLYGQMADEFDDAELFAPWTPEFAAAGGGDCGCAAKFAAATQTAAAATADYGVFGDMAPYDSSLFQATLDGPTAMQVTEDGRVFGHAFLWESCNRGYRGMCLPPPKSSSGYGQFHLGAVRTDKGLLPVGKIVQGEGHPDTGSGARIARAYYDRTSKTVAIGRITEDKWGGAFAGVIAPGATPEDVTMLLASPPSGDWKDNELIAVLAVNVPGHVVPRATLMDGRPVNMTAAGRYWPQAAEPAVSDVVDPVLTFAPGLFAEIDDELWKGESEQIAAVFAA